MIHFVAFSGILRHSPVPVEAPERLLRGGDIDLFCQLRPGWRAATVSANFIWLAANAVIECCSCANLPGHRSTPHQPCPADQSPRMPKWHEYPPEAAASAKIRAETSFS